MTVELFHFKAAAIAESDGSCWTYSEECPACERSGPVQTGDVVATLVSEPEGVVGSDSGMLLITREIADAAIAAGISIRTRPAVLLDHLANHVGHYVQLAASETLQTQSATRESCGCIGRVDWHPLAVSRPDEQADTFWIDSNPGVVLVSRRLSELLLAAAPKARVDSIRVAEIESR